MRRRQSSCRRYIAAAACAVAVLSALEIVHADAWRDSDVSELRLGMDQLAGFLESSEYARRVSWDEHVVLAYRLAGNREPGAAEFHLLRKMRENFKLSRSRALLIALRGNEKHPTVNQIRAFLSRVRITDFQTDGTIRETARRLTAIAAASVFSDLAQMPPKTYAPRQDSARQPGATQATPNESYNIYFGYLHAHSSISDGAGSPQTAYAYARNTGGLDFFALTDHDVYLIRLPWEADKWESIQTAANNAYQPGAYVTLWGFEWSSPVYGHVCVINSSDFTDTLTDSSLNGLFGWMNGEPQSFGRFNHPGEYDSSGTEFNHLALDSGAVEKMVGIETWNTNKGFGTYYYQGSWSSLDYSFGDIGNRNGWYLGALGGQDNHGQDWGTMNQFRTAVLAPALTREAIVDAYRQRRFYATEDKTLHLDFRCHGYPMGSRLSGLSPVFRVRAWDEDGDTFREVRLYRNGDLLRTVSVSGNSIDIQLDAGPPGGSPAYYYVIVQQNDDSDGDGRNDEAISSPIWITPGTADTLLDLNADGKVDFLWRYNPTGALAYWLMDGVTITAGGGITTLSTDWQLTGTPDLNADGKADLLWRHTPTGTIAYWIMSNASIASTGTIGSVPSDWRIAGMADFNADGKPDILWQHTPTGTVAVWYLSGTNLDSSAVITAVGTDWQIAGTPDLNADGKPDILWRQASTGLVAYWLMDGVTIQAGGGIATVPSNWHIVGTPDLNNDGKPDILWHDSTTGTVSYWYMNGTSIAGGGAITAVPTDWDIIAPR
jgi:hypothetical protein